MSFIFNIKKNGFYLTLEECKLILVLRTVAGACCFYLTLEECKLIKDHGAVLLFGSFYLTLEECK